MLQRQKNSQFIVFVLGSLKYRGCPAWSANPDAAFIITKSSISQTTTSWPMAKCNWFSETVEGWSNPFGWVPLSLDSVLYRALFRDMMKTDSCLVCDSFIVSCRPRHIWWCLVWPMQSDFSVFCLVFVAPLIISHSILEFMTDQNLLPAALYILYFCPDCLLSGYHPTHSSVS